MKFTLYTADCVGSLPNSIYPHKCVITDENSMKAAVAFDHVAAEYTNGPLYFSPFNKTIGLHRSKWLWLFRVWNL